VEVRLARNAAEVEQALDLRVEVFCGEQGVAVPAERDRYDDHALHFVAVEDGRVVGTCRLVMLDRVARLGRMAVERLHRGTGIGAELLAIAERAALEAGAERVRLHAQLEARSFYARGGYEEQGEPFVEEGIDHITMERALA
jgi:predicted GNAT family N-acyltransferase